LTKLTTKSFH